MSIILNNGTREVRINVSSVFKRNIWTISHSLEWQLSQKKEGGRDVEKDWNIFALGGNVKWYNHYGKQVGSSSKIKSRITT